MEHQRQRQSPALLQSIAGDTRLPTWHEVDLAHNLMQMAWSALRSTLIVLLLPDINEYSPFDQFHTNYTVLWKVQADFE